VKTIRLNKRSEAFVILAARAAIRGEHLGPVPGNWREIRDWWRTEGRRAHIMRRARGTVRFVDAAVELLAALAS